MTIHSPYNEFNFGLRFELVVFENVNVYRLLIRAHVQYSQGIN